MVPNKNLQDLNKNMQPINELVNQKQSFIKIFTMDCKKSSRIKI